MTARTQGPAPTDVPRCPTCGSVQRREDPQPPVVDASSASPRSRRAIWWTLGAMLLVGSITAAWMARRAGEQTPSARIVRSHAGLHAATLSWSGRVKFVRGQQANVQAGDVCRIVADVWTDRAKLADAQIRVRCAEREIYRGSYDDALSCALFEHATATPDRYRYDLMCEHPDPPTSQVFRFTMRTDMKRMRVIGTIPRYRILIDIGSEPAEREGPPLLDRLR